LCTKRRCCWCGGVVAFWERCSCWATEPVVSRCHSVEHEGGNEDIYFLVNLAAERASVAHSLAARSCRLLPPRWKFLGSFFLRDGNSSLKTKEGRLDTPPNIRLSLKSTGRRPWKLCCSAAAPRPLEAAVTSQP